MSKEIELCCRCDEPTGNAGKYDDSLYCEYCGEGPYCEKCFDQHMDIELRKRGLRK